MKKAKTLPVLLFTLSGMCFSCSNPSASSSSSSLSSQEPSAPASSLDATAPSSSSSEGSTTYSELLMALYPMPEFRTLVNRRYQELAQGIQTYYDELFTTAFYDENRKAIGKNFVRWSSNNNPMPGAPSSTLTQEKAESDWIENCKTLENWFKRRIRFLSGEWK